MMSSIASLLQEGVAAARAGQRERARALLTRVTETEPDNVTAWLWLSGVAATLAEAVTYLERAVEAEPENVKAQQALATARRHLSDTRVQDACEAIEAGETEAARDLLMQAVACDESNVAAWWQLRQVVEAPDEYEICLENVLALDPDHAEARAALESARRDRALTSAVLDEAADAPALDSQAEDSWMPVITLPFISPPESEAAPVPPAIPTPDILDDELHCPYCATPTAWEDRRCAVCGRALWTRQREVERRASPYWVLIILEVTLCFGGLLLPLLLLTYVDMRVEFADITQLFPVYLGMRNITPAGAAVVFGLAPRLLFWLSLIPSGLSALILLSVLSRWLPLYFTALLAGALRILAGISSAVIVMSTRLEPAKAALHGALEVAPAGQFINLVRTGITAADLGLVALATFALVSLASLQDHFALKSRRLLLRIDNDVEGSQVGLWLRGRAYAQQKVWALAALHLRQAVMIEKHLEVYLALGVAYINLACFDLAEATLKQARRLSPENPQIDELTELLAEKRAAESALYGSTA